MLHLLAGNDQAIALIVLSYEHRKSLLAGSNAVFLIVHCFDLKVFSTFRWMSVRLFFPISHANDHNIWTCCCETKSLAKINLISTDIDRRVSELGWLIHRCGHMSSRKILSSVAHSADIRLILVRDHVDEQCLKILWYLQQSADVSLNLVCL